MREEREGGEGRKGREGARKELHATLLQSCHCLIESQNNACTQNRMGAGA